LSQTADVVTLMMLRVTQCVQPCVEHPAQPAV